MISELNNLNIWVGAGISIKEPTNLPSGNELMEFVADNTLLFPKKIFDVWTQCNNIIKDDIKINSMPRLELLLSSVSYTERYLVKDNFFSGFESFNNVNFNYNHLLLATLLHEGANIITPNFDLCIEKAYNYLYNENLCERCKNKKNEIIFKTSKKSYIIHYHGTTSSGKSMGATIENILEIVDKNIRDKISSCFNQNKSNYFFGYSFSDIYDINTTIIELYSKSSNDKTKKNFVCNHLGYDKNLEDRVKSIFKENVSLSNTDTTEEIKKIFNIYNIDLPPNNTFNNDYRWNDIFSKAIHISDNFRIITTIHFLNRLKIAIEQIDNEILEKYELIRDTILSEKRMVLEYHLAANSSKYFDKFGYSRLDEYHKNCLHNRQQYSSQKGIIKINEQEISNTISTNLKFINYETANLISDEIKKIKIAKILNPDSLKLYNLPDISNILKKIKISDTIESVLYASLIRYNMFIDILVNKHYSLHFKSSLDIYYDIGNLEGIIATYIDKAIAERNSNKYPLSARQNSDLEKARKLCILIGSYRYLDMLQTIYFLTSD